MRSKTATAYNLQLHRRLSPSRADLSRPKTAPERRSTVACTDGPATAGDGRHCHSEESSSSFSCRRSLTKPCPGSSYRSTRTKRQRLDEESPNNNDHPHPGLQQSSHLPPSRRRSLPRSRSLPLEPPVRRSSNSPSSTLSPSQPSHLNNLVPRPQTQESPGAPTCAFVDLTTPEHARQGVERSHLHRPRNPDHQRTVQVRECEDERSRLAHQPRVVNSQLPDLVLGPNPKGGRSRFTTHLTKTLERVSKRVPLSRYFRPAYVARDVGVLERGYWQFCIRIEDGSIRKPRRASSEQHHSPPWTEGDFGQFWQGISQFIQHGKAGWGTRLVKEARDSNQWSIRLFTWAELLGHIWVILWILSDKLIQGVPMQWIAGDGSVVVQMPGAKTRRRRSSVWMRKGPEGEGGTWGLRRLETSDEKKDS